MSAESCVIFYGVSFELIDDEIEICELRKDPRMQMARGAGLDCHWGAFGIDQERYLLFIGLLLGIFGPEHRLEGQYSPESLLSAFQEVNKKLQDAGLQGEPKLFVQYALDQ